MKTGGSFDAVISALKALGGFFTFEADDGSEYVVIGKKEFEDMKHAAAEKQLDLLSSPRQVPQPASPDQMLEKINRDIANWQMYQHESDLDEALDMEDDLGLNDMESKSFDLAQGKKVRFEPLKGDLSPDLQE